MQGAHRGLGWIRLTLLIAVGLSGCVDQKKEVALYRAVLDTQPAESPTSQPAGELTLQQALYLANQHDERLAISGENYVQALIDKTRAVAGFLPTFNLSPAFVLIDRPATSGSSNSAANIFRSAVSTGLTQATHDLANAMTGVANTGNAGTGGTGSSAGNPFEPSGSTGSSGSFGSFGSYRTTGPLLERFDVPVNGQINLFNGFGDIANMKRTAATAQEYRWLLLDLQALVLLDVARTYYQILQSQEQVRVLRGSLEVQEERVRTMRGRQAAGTARPLDVAQSEALAAATRVSLVTAGSDVRNGRTLLAFLIDAEVGELPLRDDFRVPDDLRPTADFVAEALASRQDFQAAQAAVHAARAAVDMAISRYFPSVTFNINAFLYSENYALASKWNSILSANLPLFSAGLIEADVRAAWSMLRQALLKEALLRRQIAQDVDIGHENVRASKERLANLAVQVAAAAEAFGLADKTYNVGLATNLERLTAQLQLLNAQLDQAREQADFKINYLSLLRVAGSLSLTSLAQTQSP